MNDLTTDLIRLMKQDSIYKWNTAENMAKKLASKYSCDAEQIETLLINYVKNNHDAEIRYSSLPSRRTLKVLWGHIERVGERKVEDIFRTDIQLIPDYLDNVQNERNMFLSHSFKDTDGVITLSRKLVKYDLNPWLAEVDIHRGGHIHNEVIHAIENLPFFGIYLTKHVLQSAWSAKEFEFAVNNKKKLFAFIPPQEYEIIQLIQENLDNPSAHQLLQRLFDNSDIRSKINFYFTSKNDTNFNTIKPFDKILEVLNI